MPRPKIPNQVQILNVAPGTNAGSSGGVYLTADSLITARLTGDDSAFFTIGQLETFDVDFDPDARPPQEVLVVALRVSGAGPIEAFQSEAILVTVEFACPADPLKATFHATAILEGAGLSAPISVPVTATARVGILQAFNIGNPLISPQDTENFTFLVSSTLGHPFRLRFDMTANSNHYSPLLHSFRLPSRRMAISSSTFRFFARRTRPSAPTV